MANKITNTQYYTEIANAIRSKLGVQTTYLPSQMPAAINSIPTGGMDNYRFSVAGSKIYGKGSSYVQPHGEQVFNIDHSQITGLGLTGVRFRGDLYVEAAKGGKSATAELIMYNRKLSDGTYSETIIKSLSSGTSTSSASAYAKWAWDKTFNFVTDDIQDLNLYLKVTSRSNVAIDANTYGTIGSWGNSKTYDQISWFGLIVDFLNN